MPFIFRDCDESIVHVGQCSEDEWLKYKEEWRALGLHMACCDADAVPVYRTQYQTRFVRHHRGEDCGSEGESIEHQALKADAAVAAQAAGWSVKIEGGGASPDGEQWRADVLCSRGTERVAIEIQMSRQSLADYRRRQAIYAASGVKGIWFAGHKGFDRNWSTPDLPIFPVRLDGLEGTTAPARHGFRLPIGQFVGEFLDGRWYCRRPIAAPAAIVPELAICADCGREVLTGHIVAAYPAEADPAYPPGPIFAHMTDVLHEGNALTWSGWNRHEIMVLGRNASPCPSCDGDLRYAKRFTIDDLCKAQRSILERHGTVLLPASGWWRKGEPLVPRNWQRPSSPPMGGTVPIAEIIERQRHRLSSNARSPSVARKRILAAIRSAVDDLDDWTVEVDFGGFPLDREDAPWRADIVLQETGMSQCGRRIAFFIAVGSGALDDRRRHALTAKKSDYGAIVVNPTTEVQRFTNHPPEILLSEGDRVDGRLMVAVGNEIVPLAQFATDLVQGKWVVRSSAKVPFAFVPVPASCQCCGRTGTIDGFMALHLGEADVAFGDGIAIMPVMPYSGVGGYGSKDDCRLYDLSKNLICLCGNRMVSSISAADLLAECGDLQVRDGFWHYSIGPWIRRGSIPLPEKALGLLSGNRIWTKVAWIVHAERLAPPPDGEVVRMRKALLSSILKGAAATGQFVDESHASQGVVVVNRGGGSRIAIAFLSTFPGEGAAYRQAAEVKAADAVLQKVQAEETFWFTVAPHPELPRGHHREAILINWESGDAFALRGEDEWLPLERFVEELLEGALEYLRRQTLRLTLVPEQVRCPTCGESAHIAPWCAATVPGRKAPSFARILGNPKEVRLLSLKRAEEMRRSAERQLRMPPFEKREGAVVQCCRRCDRILESMLTTEMLRRFWSGPGVGHTEATIELYGWYPLALPLLAGCLTVPGRIDVAPLTVGQWLSAIRPQQSLL